MLRNIHSFFSSLGSDQAKVLRSSVTWRTYLTSALVFGAVFLLCTVILFMDIRDPYLGTTDLFTLQQVLYGIAYFFLLAPLCLYNIWAPLRILIHAERYVFREVLLERPEAAGRGFVSFTVTFPDHTDRPTEAKTLPVRLSILSHTGDRALIAHNPKTQLTVLIRPLEDVSVD